MESKRNIVKIEGELVEVGNTSTWQGLVATFLSTLDIKESSRNLYKRTLSQYFIWIGARAYYEANTAEAERGTEPIDYYSLLVKSEGKGNKDKVNEIINLYVKENLPSMERRDILDYKNNLLQLEKSPLTVGSYIVAVRKFYEWAEAEKLYPNIAKAVKTPRRTSDKETFIKENLTESKSKELLQYFYEKSLRDYAIVNLILRTGLRTIEVVRANIEDITFKTGRRILKVWGKGHESKDDFVVLTDKAYEPIRAYLEARQAYKDKDPLFISSSNRNNGGRLTTRTISGLCKDGLIAIGLDTKQYTAHSLRHTTGCTLIQKGAHVDDVMRTMRHTNPVTTMRYVKKVQQEEHLKNPVEDLLDEAF